MRALMDCVPKHDVWAAGLRLKVFLLLLLLAAVGVLLYEQHGLFAIVLSLVAVGGWVALSPKAAINVHARRHDNLIDFARRFDVRVVNAWVVRSTYEQLGLWLGFPVHPSDRLYWDLKLSAADLEEIVFQVLVRVERVRPESWLIEAKTVRELIFFINTLPKSKP